MLNLRQVCLGPHQWLCLLGAGDAKTYIRVRLIHEGIEHLHSLPDTHAGTATALEVDASLDIEGDGLLFCRYHESEMVMPVTKQSGHAPYHVAPYRNS